MKLWKESILFSLGGTGYVGLELLFRGRSHYSMFLAGGCCFLLLGELGRARPRLPRPLLPALGGGIITMVELAAGLIFNRDYGIWDYRHLPMNYHGQICLPFTLLWCPLSAGAMFLYNMVARFLPGGKGN